MRTSMHRAWKLTLLVLLTGCIGVGYAAVSDLQQYNRSAANIEAANSANALTSTLLLPTDGKIISADNNSAGKAPVNLGTKAIADYATGTRCSLWGNCSGVTQRSVASLLVDGTGGVSHSENPGNIRLKRDTALVTIQNVAGTLVHLVGTAGSTIADTSGASLDIRNTSFRWRNTAGTDANPPKGQAIANELRALNTPKAWFLVQADGAGAYTVVDGAGIASAAASGVAGDIEVTMATAMDSSSYAVIASGLQNSAAAAVGAVPISAIAFRLDVGTLSCASVTCTVHGVVYGRQTTP